jgi:hypothetical protein
MGEERKRKKNSFAPARIISYFRRGARVSQKQIMRFFLAVAAPAFRLADSLFAIKYSEELSELLSYLQISQICIRRGFTIDDDNPNPIVREARRSDSTAIASAWKKRSPLDKRGAKRSGCGPVCASRNERSNSLPRSGGTIDSHRTIIGRSRRVIAR